MSDIPLDDQKEFDVWLRARWVEKDQLLDECFETGRFPSELAGSIESGSGSEKQKAAASAGYVETYVRLSRWTEIGQIFIVLAAIAAVCKFLPKLWAL